jgi:hypothetical protein
MRSDGERVVAAAAATTAIGSRSGSTAARKRFADALDAD